MGALLRIFAVREWALVMRSGRQQAGGVVGSVLKSNGELKIW
jgi:hypothetical protein